MNLISLFNFLMSQRKFPDNRVIRSCGVYIPGTPTVLKKELHEGYSVFCYGPYGRLKALQLDWTILPPGKYSVEMGVSYQHCSDWSCFAQAFLIKMDEKFTTPQENCQRILWTAPRFYHGWIMGWNGKNKTTVDIKCPAIIGVYASWLKITPVEMYKPEIKMSVQGKEVIIYSTVKSLGVLSVNGKKSYIWLTGKNVVDINEYGSVTVCCDYL